MGNDALSFLTNTSSCSLLIELLEEPSYANELSKVLDTDYGYVQRVLQKFEEYDLVTSESEGRKRMYELTETGRDAADLLDQLHSTLGGENQ